MGGVSIMGSVMVYVPPSHMTPQGSGRPNGGSYKGGSYILLFWVTRARLISISTTSAT